MKAALTADRLHVMCRKDQWSEVFPVSKLDSRIAFYERLTQRPRTGHHYAASLAALKKIKEKLK